MQVVIVGGGVVGLLSALELRQAGCNVIVLERGLIGEESSWAGGGIVSPLYPWRYPPAVTALATVAQAVYPQLAAQLLAETGIDAEFNPCGMLMLDAPDERDALAWALEYGKDIERLHGEALSKLAPHLQGFGHALWLPHVANVRNPYLLRALRRAAELRGVKLLEHHQVCAWRQQDERIVAVQCHNGQQFAAEHVVVTAGAWTQGLLALADVDVPVVPVKGQMLLYKVEPGTLQHIVLHEGHYLIPRRDGHVLCGSTLEPGSFDKSLTVEAREQLEAVAHRLLPILAQQTPVAHWAGLRPGSPNGIPFIGRTPRYGNLWVNAGQYRNGLVLAPASAQLLADLLLERRPSVSPAPYQLL